MAHRVNIMLDDDLWKILKKVPRGERSKVINETMLATIKSQQKRDLQKNGCPGKDITSHLYGANRRLDA